MDPRGGMPLRELLPKELCLKIANHMPPNANVKKDLIIWSLSKSGKCTVKSAYESLCPEKSTKAGSNSPWKCIWSWKGPKRIRVFLWLAFQ